MPPEQQELVDGSVNAVAERIAAARAAGELKRPDGPPPPGARDAEDDYTPSQNLHTDDETPEQSSEVTPEQLRREALGLDDDQTQEGEVEDTAVDEEQELEASADEDEPTDADDGESQEIELTFDTLDELAELVGLETEDLLSRVRVSTLVDGELGEITLADMRKGHQLESSFTRKNQAFVERQKAFNQEQEQRRAQVNDHYSKAVSALNMAQQQLYADFNGIDWNALQRDNPQEWTMKRQQLGERQARLNQAMKSTEDQMRQTMEQQQKEQSDARERHLDEQHNLLMAAVPAWKKDPKIAEKEGAQIAQYLAEVGYTPEEIESCEDHRLILMGRAALGLSGPSKRKLSLTKKKVEKVQNLVKPGNSDKRRKTGQAAFTKKAQDAKATLKRTGRTEDAAQALLARKLARQASAKRGRRSRV